MEKRKGLIILLIISMELSCTLSLFAQDSADSRFNVGADFYSSYIWRGSKFGTGPSIQPEIEYSGNWLKVGAWGAFDFTGYQEADLYFSISLPAGLSIGLTDYYFPDLQYNDFTKATGSHAYELNAGFSAGNLNLAANFVFNRAGGAGSLGGDKYFQADYSFKLINIFIGAGDGWHTYDPETLKDKFAVCNLGIGSSKTIKVTDSFSIPVNAQVIFNPDKNQMFLVIGFTL